jgi:hypothetical protein
MKEIQAFSGAIWRTLGVLMGDICSLVCSFFASTCGLEARGEQEEDGCRISTGVSLCSFSG